MGFRPISPDEVAADAPSVSVPGFRPISADEVAPEEGPRTWGDTAGNLARSLGRGTANLIGSAATVLDPAQALKGVMQGNFVNEYFGVPSPNKMLGLPDQPTPQQQVLSAFTDVVGDPNYTNAGKAERYGGAALEALPWAAGGGAGFAIDAALSGVGAEAGKDLGINPIISSLMFGLARPVSLAGGKALASKFIGPQTEAAALAKVGESLGQYTKPDDLVAALGALERNPLSGSRTSAEVLQSPELAILEQKIGSGDRALEYAAAKAMRGEKIEGLINNVSPARGAVDETTGALAQDAFAIEKAASKKAVTELYDAIPGDVRADVMPLSQKITAASEKFFGEGSPEIPGKLQKAIDFLTSEESIGSGVSLQALQRSRSHIGDIARSAFRAGDNETGALASSINNAIKETIAGAPEGASAWKAANEAYKVHAARFKEGPLSKIESVLPSKTVNKIMSSPESAVQYQRIIDGEAGAMQPIKDQLASDISTMTEAQKANFITKNESQLKTLLGKDFEALGAIRDDIRSRIDTQKLANATAGSNTALKLSTVVERALTGKTPASNSGVWDSLIKAAGMGGIGAAAYHNPLTGIPLILAGMGVKGLRNRSDRLVQDALYQSLMKPETLLKALGGAKAGASVSPIVAALGGAEPLAGKAVQALPEGATAEGLGSGPTLRPSLSTAPALTSRPSSSEIATKFSPTSETVTGIPSHKYLPETAAGDILKDSGFISHYQNTTKQLPELQAILKDAAQGLPVKSGIKKIETAADKIVRKIKDGKAKYDETAIGDLIRGNVVAKDSTEAGAVLKRLQDSGVVEGQVEDYMMRANSMGYQGINVNIRTPGGALAEVQIHTPHTLAIQDAIHGVYEKWRNSGQKSIPRSVVEESQLEAAKALVKSKGGKLVAESPYPTVESPYPTYEIPIEKLRLSKDVPQWKGKANARGTTKDLGGDLERRGLGPVQVWERLNGDLEIISGRHRFALAQDKGAKSIPVQIYREADGFTAAHARTLDAELNILKGHGSVEDYIRYMKETGISREEALSKGFLHNDKGKTGFEIASGGSDDLISHIKKGNIDTDQAYAIAKAAPGNDGLQRVGIRSALKGNDGDHIEKVMKMISKDPRVKQTGGQMSLLNDNDPAMLEAEEMVSRAAAKESAISKKIRAGHGSASAADIAKEEFNIDVADVSSAKGKLKALKAERQQWKEFADHPALQKQIKEEMKKDGFYEDSKQAGKITIGAAATALALATTALQGAGEITKHKGPASFIERAMDRAEDKAAGKSKAIPAVSPLKSFYDAVQMQESRGKPNAVSPKGATGLMQIMPATAADIAKQLGIKKYDLKDPTTNRLMGEYYLASMMEKYKGNKELALAAYNAGPGAVDSWIKIYGKDWGEISKALKKRQAYKETVAYVPQVLSRMV